MKEENKYTTGFTTPEHYFDEIENRILAAVIEKELPKDNGFKVPDGYFEDTERVLLNIPNTEKTKKVRVIPLYKKRAFIFTASVAACVALIVSLVNFSSETSITLNDINTETIATYIDDGNLELSAQEIALFLQEEDINVLGMPSEEISNENITDYLLNNIDDPSFYLE